MNRILLFLFFISISASVVSQNIQPKAVSKKKQKQSIAKEHISQLKSGALLVRLQSKKNTISILRKSGNDQQADIIEKKQAEENLCIIQAFRQKFQFCPTYFFYNDFTNQIINNQIENIIFLNDSLKPDSTIKLNYKFLYIAEFGNISHDTAKYISKRIPDSSAKAQAPIVNYNYVGSDITFGALIIKTIELKQLKRPFPYYARTSVTLPIKKSSKKAVRKLNNKLNAFYNKKK